MRIRTPALTVLALSSAVLLSGCYGSTEPATELGVDSATFHGQGTSNAGPAHVYFQYWPTKDPSALRATYGQNVPANHSGPVSESTLTLGPTPFGPLLDPATNYSFRLCATDQGSPGGVCAQTRTFDTATPSGDYVRGVVNNIGGSPWIFGNFSAQSDAHGGSPSGGIFINTLGGSAALIFSGNVTCLSVHGSDAIIGGVGVDVANQPATIVINVRTGTTKSVTYHTASGSVPPACVASDFGAGLTAAAVVYDTP